MTTASDAPMHPGQWLRGPTGAQPRRLIVRPWEAVTRTWRWRPGEPFGPCAACRLPCWVRYRGLVLHPTCPDPRQTREAS